MPDQESAINWKFIAQERLQMLTQMRDDMQAWHEAYLEENERADRLEARLFKALGIESDEPKEEKHVVQTPAQVNTRRANWPRVRNELEKRFASFGNDIKGQEIELNEETTNALESA